MQRTSRSDRRFDDRHPGTGLVLRLNDTEIEVIDVSIGGMKFPIPPGLRPFPGEVLEGELVSLRWPDMRPAKARIEPRAMASGWVAVQFVQPSYDLMKMVSRHVATLLWGDKPYGY